MSARVIASMNLRLPRILSHEFVKANLMRSQTAAAFAELFDATLAGHAHRDETMGANRNANLGLDPR